MRPTQAVLRPLTAEGRRRLFGDFAYKADPITGNGERIRITDNWAKENLVTIPLGALAAAEGADKATFHRLVAPRFQELVEAWERAGVLQDVLTWNGSYAARFIRGSRVNLSAHAWASAFDVNIAHNRLGAEPAKLGQKGSVLRLVSIAEAHGFYWGGRFSRKDGQHFELAKL
jgi:hypothetical protein